MPSFSGLKMLIHQKGVNSGKDPVEFSLYGLFFVLCLVVKCPALSAPANGEVGTQPPTPVYQTIVSLTCNTGYILGGSSSRTCQADGSWSGTNSTCTSKCYKKKIRSSS